MAHRNSRKRRILEWDDGSDTEDIHARPTTTNIPHTEVHLGDSGSRSTQTSFLSAPISPAKTARSSNVQAQYYYKDYIDQQTHDEDHLPEPLPAEASDCDEESDDDLDPAYERHLNEQEPGPPKAKRRPRVSNCFVGMVFYNLTPT